MNINFCIPKKKTNIMSDETLCDDSGEKDPCVKMCCKKNEENGSHGFCVYGDSNECRVYPDSRTVLPYKLATSIKTFKCPVQTTKFKYGDMCVDDW